MTIPHKRPFGVFIMAIPSRNGPGWMGCLSSRFILHIWKPKLSMTVLVRQGRSQCTIRVMVLNYFSWNIPASDNYFCLFVLFYFSPFSLTYWLCGWVDSPRSVPAVKCAPLTRLSRCLSLVSLEFEFGCPRAAAHEDRPAYQSDRRVTTQQLIAGLTWDPGGGTHYMKVTTYAPPFRPPFFRSPENLYSFDPYILAKWGKCRISTPIFHQNWAKCIVSTPLFGPL